QPAVEEHAAGQLQPSFAVPRQQFLSDAVAVVMREYVDGAIDAQFGQQRLLDVRLLEQAVVMPARLGRVAEAEHVAGDHPVALRQRLPERLPVPAGGGKAVNKQQRLALTCRPVADRQTTEREALRSLTPLRQARGTPVHWR